MTDSEPQFRSPLGRKSMSKWLDLAFCEKVTAGPWFGYDFLGYHSPMRRSWSDHGVMTVRLQRVSATALRRLNVYWGNMVYMLADSDVVATSQVAITNKQWRPWGLASQNRSRWVCAVLGCGKCSKRRNFLGTEKTGRYAQQHR